jgi:protein-glutamine gamma-glutamyltransferase
MSTLAQKPGVIPLHRAIDHYFELALYLMVLTGFGTLAGTGGLDLPSILLVGIALAIRGYLLAKRRHFVISERWTTPLSVAYFFFFAVDYLAVARSFLPATIHLALFGVVVRMFSLRRERDHITLAILAFLMVLASAVLTVDSVFLFSFSTFLLMAVATFILFEMRRSGATATIRARHSRDEHEHRRLAFALLSVVPLLMALILAGGAALFFLMPRISAGYLGGYSFGTDLSSGFSDHVQLGQIGQIQQSNSVVMHVEIEGDTIGSHDLYWRGITLGTFDGSAWSSPREQFILPRQPDTSFALPRNSPVARSYSASSLGREKIIRYRALMEPIGTQVFFLAPWAQSLRGDYRLVAGDSGGAVYNLDPRHAISRYEASSNIATPTAAELRAAGRDYPETVAEPYLRLPALDPRIAQLAEQITGSAANDYDRAQAIEHHLRTHFSYTLELPETRVKDPIANFLFVRKQGHCEYFASSMAVMLRMLGIPSRVVNGFHGDEFNDVSGSYIIRAKNAHSWVEVYFPGYGWQTFDPTPAASTSTPQGWERITLYLDAMASFWRDWIISYDSSNQYTLGKAAITSSRNLLEGARTWASNRYGAMLNWARRSQNRVEDSPRRWALTGLAVALALLVLANLGRIARALEEYWLAAHPGRSPKQAAAMWYERMSRVAAKRGMKKSDAQTPQEFVRKIEHDRWRAPIARFTDVYESARFGNSAEAARQLPELYEEVETAMRSGSR